MKVCPKCKSINLIHSGFAKNKARFKCKDCSYHFTTLEKTGSVKPNDINDAYRLYRKKNLTLSKVFSELNLGLTHTTARKWFSTEYWESKRMTENPFYFAAKQLDAVSDITSYFSNVTHRIKLKPLKTVVKIQYLINGKKTSQEMVVDLFTLSKIRESEGEIRFSVKLNYLELIQRFGNYELKENYRKYQNELYQSVSFKDWLNAEYIPSFFAEAHYSVQEFVETRLVKETNERLTIPSLSSFDFIEYVLDLNWQLVSLIAQRAALQQKERYENFLSQNTETKYS